MLAGKARGKCQIDPILPIYWYTLSLLSTKATERCDNMVLEGLDKATCHRSAVADM